jgi:hypothetical protein
VLARLGKKIALPELWGRADTLAGPSAKKIEVEKRKRAY